MISYKGHNINVKYNSKAQNEYRFNAYTYDEYGEHEHTHGVSKEDAVSKLKQKIDNYDIHKKHYLRPLEADELKELKDYIRKNSFTIARTIKKEHYIIPDRFPPFSIRAIYNHWEDIEKTLKDCGEQCNINTIVIENTTTKKLEKIALYSTDYYNTESKCSALEDTLLNDE